MLQRTPWLILRRRRATLSALGRRCATIAFMRSSSTDSSRLLERIERRRRQVATLHRREDKHLYFHNVAKARYVLRRVFRIVEEVASRHGIDPLYQQALLQIYGAAQPLRIRALADRLDIAPAFASTIVKWLAAQQLVERRPDPSDQRAMTLTATDKGIDLLYQVDADVKREVDYFTSKLGQAEKEAAISILMFYVGL